MYATAHRGNLAVEPRISRSVIQLDHRAVNVAGQMRPLLVDAQNFLPDFIGIRQLFVGNHLETKAFQVFQRVTMTGKGHTLCQLHIEYQNVQLPLGRDPGILLPQRTGGGVSGVGKGLFPRLFQGVIQFMEGLLGHIYFPPDNEPGRRVFQHHGNGADGPQILCYILAHCSVAPGGAPDKTAILVFQGHRQAVNLGLNGKRRLGKALSGAQQKIIQLFHAENILQAHQRYRVTDFSKCIHRLAPHPPGGRIRQGKFGMGLFQVLQLPQKTVVFKIRHIRVIQHIVPVSGIVKKLCQLLHSLFGFHKCLLS